MAGRFRRDPHGPGGGKVRSRVRTPADAAGGRASPGDFLARLWTLFGAPDQAGDGGFEYRLRDTATGLPFTAYAGAGGPAYAALRGDAEGLDSVLDDFDALLDATPLADCEIGMAAGQGRYRLGARGGVPFEEHLPGTEALDARLRDAALVLARADGEVWDFLNPLLELAGDTARADASPVLRALWLRAFSAASDTIHAIARGERGRRGIEQIIEVALVQLEEMMDTAGIDPHQYAPRIQALREMAGPAS